MTQFNGQITVLRDDGATGRPIKWCTECLTIGSDESCDGCIYSDLIDSKHCELTLLGDDQAYLIHTGSKEFKTIVEGVEIFEPCLLTHNAIFTVGQISFRFEYPPNSKWHPKSKEVDMNHVNPISLRSKIHNHPVISTPKKNTYSIHCHKTNSPKISPIRSSNTKIKTVIPNQRLNVRPFVTPTQKKLINKSNRKSKLNLHLLKSEESRRHVSFGPNLSPEQFDKELPPKQPLKKGATPMKTRSSIINSLTKTETDNSLKTKAIRQSKNVSIISNNKSMNSSDYSLFDKSSFVLSNDSTDFANDSLPKRNYRKSNKKNSHLFDKSSFALTETSNDISTDSFAEINQRKSDHVNNSPMNYADNQRKSLGNKSMDCYDYSIENENSIMENSSSIQKNYSLKRGRKSSSMNYQKSITEEISFSDSKIDESLNLENIKELENQQQNKMAMVVNEAFSKGRKSNRNKRQSSKSFEATEKEDNENYDQSISLSKSNLDIESDDDKFKTRHSESISKQKKGNSNRDSLNKNDTRALSSEDEDKPKTNRTSSTPKLTRKSTAKARQTMDLEGLDKLYEVDEEDMNKSNSNKSKDVSAKDIPAVSSEDEDKPKTKRTSSTPKLTKKSNAKARQTMDLEGLDKLYEVDEENMNKSNSNKSKDISEKDIHVLSSGNVIEMSESHNSRKVKKSLSGKHLDVKENKIASTTEYNNKLTSMKTRKTIGVGIVNYLSDASDSNELNLRKNTHAKRFSDVTKYTKSLRSKKSVGNIINYLSDTSEHTELPNVSNESNSRKSKVINSRKSRISVVENSNLLQSESASRNELFEYSWKSGEVKNISIVDVYENVLGNTSKSSKSNENQTRKSVVASGEVSDMIELEEIHESKEISFIETPKSLNSNKVTTKRSGSTENINLLEEVENIKLFSKFNGFRKSTKSPLIRKSIINIPQRKGKSVGSEKYKSEPISMQKVKNFSNEVSNEVTIESMDIENMNQSDHDVSNKRLNAHGFRKTERLPTTRKSNVSHDRAYLSEGEEIRENDIRKSSKKFEVRKSNVSSMSRKSDASGSINLVGTDDNEEIVDQSAEASIMIEEKEIHESEEISFIETPKSSRSNKLSANRLISFDDMELLEGMVQTNKSSKFLRLRKSTKSPVTRKSAINVRRRIGRSAGGDVLESELSSIEKLNNLGVSNQKTIKHHMNAEENLDQTVHEVTNKRLNVRGFRKTEKIPTIRKSIVPNVERVCLSEGEEIEENEIISFHDIPKSKYTDKSTRSSVRISRKSDTVEYIDLSDTEDVQDDITIDRQSDKIQTRKSIDIEGKLLSDYEDIVESSPLKKKDLRKSNKGQISRKSNVVEDVSKFMIKEIRNSRQSSKLRSSNISETSIKSAIESKDLPLRDFIVEAESSHTLDSIKLNELRKSNSSRISRKVTQVSKETDKGEINENDLREEELMSPNGKKFEKATVKRKYMKKQTEPAVEVQSDDEKTTINDVELGSTVASVMKQTRTRSKITNLPEITSEKPVQGQRTRRGNKKTNTESEEPISENVNLSEIATEKPVQRTRRVNKKTNLESQELVSKNANQENLDLHQEEEKKTTNKTTKTRTTLKRNVKHLDDEISSVGTVESRVTRTKSKVISKKDFKEPVLKKSRIIENEIVEEEAVEDIDNSSVRSSRSTHKRVLKEIVTETIVERKVTRGRPKIKVVEEEPIPETPVLENFVKPKTTRGRPKTKVADEDDKNSVITSNSSMAPIKLLQENESENIKPKITRGRQVKKKVADNAVENDSSDVVSKSNKETVSENFVQPKRTRGRQKGQVVESLVDKAYDEAVVITSSIQETIDQPRSVRGRRKAQEINSSVKGDTSEIDFPTNAKKNKSRKIDNLPTQIDAESENVKENSAPKENKRGARSAKAKTLNVQSEAVSAKKGKSILNEISNTEKLKLDSNEVTSPVRTRSRRGKL